MPRKLNPKLADFRSRVDWIVDNLDPDPAFARFIHGLDGVYDAYKLAVKTGTYQAENRNIALTYRWWRNALETDSVSKEFIEWLCTLFVDLSNDHLLEKEFDEFRKLGTNIEFTRALWAKPCEFYSKNRKKLQEVGMRFYRNVQLHDLDREFPVAFPLLIQRGWIRNAPLELKENTETLRLLPLGQFPPSEEPPRLEGLNGGYITYRGKLGLAKRRAVKLEPQHNGEIFCAQSVLNDVEGSFVGFQYRLGRYFDYINTGEILGVELAKWILDSTSLDDLPGRFRLRGSPEDAFDLTNRAAYPGVNCLTIFLNYSDSKRKQGDWMLLHKRDETQSQAQNTIHVVPAGGHQGFTKSAQREDTAIWRTVVREFIEELFDKERLNNQFETWSDFDLDRDVNVLKGAFFSGDNPPAKIYLHGFGLDPITLKPEILCTIVIDWNRLTNPKPKLKFNWELKTADPNVTREVWVPLSKDELVRQATERRHSIGDHELDALPAGAACLLLTAKHYETLRLS